MKAIETREQLIRCLQKASELEHQLLCAYLVTAYTVKQDDSEGGFAEASDDENSPGFKQREFMFEKGNGRFFGVGPSRVIINVAVQEMLHLTLVNNLLASITYDSSSNFPFFDRENFPLTPQYLRDRFGYNKPSGQAWISHWEFGVEALRGWEWFENYNKDQEFNGPAFPGEALEDLPESDSHFIDSEMEISTLVELYKAIAKGIVDLGVLEKLPDGKRLFCGNKESQFNTQATRERNGRDEMPVPDVVNKPRESSAELSRFPREWGLLREINTVFEAIEAINIIVIQGEGDEEDWIEFIRELGFNPDSDVFGRSVTTHYEDFLGLRTDMEGLLQEDPSFQPGRPIRVVQERGETSVQQLAFDLAELFDDVYSTMMAIISAAFRHPIPTPESTDEEIIIARYERITLAQTGLAAMLYVLSPFGNALPQISSGYQSLSGADQGIAPRFVFKKRSDDWQNLIVQLDHLSQRALGLVDRLPDRDVWLQPDYLEFKGGNNWPKVPVKTVIRDFVGLNLEFIARRFERVKGNQPIANSQGNLHSCQGLNECKGLDITGTAARAGEGVCATAIPHTCAGLNQCNQQSMCGFARDQDVPGANIGPGSGGCQSPSLPSGKNTEGKNTPQGESEVFDRAQGNVWRYARILFEERMTEQGIPFGPSSGPGGVGGNDFPGSISSDDNSEE